MKSQKSLKQTSETGFFYIIDFSFFHLKIYFTFCFFFSLSSQLLPLNEKLWDLAPRLFSGFKLEATIREKDFFLGIWGQMNSLTCAFLNQTLYSAILQSFQFIYTYYQKFPGNSKVTRLEFLRVIKQLRVAQCNNCHLILWFTGNMACKMPRQL